jgi:phospholipase/carboxylesterase
VIWLHGLGADGTDFVPAVPQLRLPDEVAPRFIFPNAPVRPVTVNNGMRMRAWYDIYSLGMRDREDATGIRESAAVVHGLIDAERAAGISARRIVLAGFSQGGAIALQAGLRYAEPLAGILALSTYLPLATTVAAEASVANREIPILMCHGREDPIVPLELAEKSADILNDLGYHPRWLDYPMQHQVCAAEMLAISQWLTQVLPPL